MSLDSTTGDASSPSLVADRPVLVDRGGVEVQPDLEHDLVEVIAAEQLLLTTTTTGDVALVERLLHPEFIEVAESGKAWDRRAILRLLATRPGSPGCASGFRAVRLGPDAVLLTYRTTGDRPTFRSSVWLRGGTAGWQLRYHQGTDSAD